MGRHRVTAQEEIESDSRRDPSTVSEKGEKKESFRAGDNVLDDGTAREDKEGVVRIRVLVTKEELKRILSGSGLGDDLLSAVRLRSMSVVVSGGGSGDDDGDVGGKCWRPALESIPEDH